MRRDDLKSKDLTSFMIAGSGAFDHSEHMVAVQKNFSGKRSSCALLSRAELDKAVDAASANVAIQRLVHAAGARAAVSRVTVAAGTKTRRAPVVYVLTRVEDKGSVEEANVLSAKGEGGGSMNAKIHWLTASEEFGTTGIAPARGTNIAWNEPAGMCERIIDHVNRRGTKLSFVITELTADFIKEADGTWWMLQVKSFKSQPRAAPIVREVGGGGIGVGGVERRGVQSARHGGVQSIRNGRGGGSARVGGAGRGKKEGGGGGGGGEDDEGNNGDDDENEKNGSDEVGCLQVELV